MSQLPVLIPDQVLPAEPLGPIPELGPVDRFLLEPRRRRSRESYTKALWRAALLLEWVIPLEKPPPGKRRSREKSLEIMRRELSNCPWAHFTVEVAMALEEAMRQAELAKRTQNQVKAAVRGVLEECLELELIDDKRHRQLAKRLRSEKPPPYRVPKGLFDDELYLKIHEVCRKAGPVGLRDLAIFDLCAVLRRSEVAALDVRDVDLDSGIVWVDDGKGGKTAETALDPASLPLLREWNDYRRKHGRKKPDTPFVGRFVYTRKGKGEVRYTGEWLTPQSIYDRCRQRSKEAGTKRVTPHNFRRRYGTKHNENGTPLREQQKLMRHANPATTASYDHSGFKTALKWAGNASLPWHRKAEPQD